MFSSVSFVQLWHLFYFSFCQRLCGFCLLRKPLFSTMGWWAHSSLVIGLIAPLLTYVVVILLQWFQYCRAIISLTGVCSNIFLHKRFFHAHISLVHLTCGTNAKLQDRRLWLCAVVCMHGLYVSECLCACCVCVIRYPPAWRWVSLSWFCVIDADWLTWGTLTRCYETRWRYIKKRTWHEFAWVLNCGIQCGFQ